MARLSPEAERVPTPLTRLLRTRMDQEGWVLRDVTRPPDGLRPGGPARSTMSQHLTPGYWLQTLPRPRTIKELAIAVRLSEEKIKEAAWRSLESNRDLPDPQPGGTASLSLTAGVAVGRGRQGDDALHPEDFSEEQWRQVRKYAEFVRSQNPDA